MSDPDPQAVNQDQPSKGANGSEKRYLPRWQVDNRVLYKKDNEQFYRECRSRDINSEGASIILQERLHPPQKLTLVVYLSENVAVHVHGRVLWADAVAHQNIVGVHFENTNRNIQDMILQYAFDFSKEALTKHWFEGWE